MRAKALTALVVACSTFLTTGAPAQIASFEIGTLTCGLSASGADAPKAESQLGGVTCIFKPRSGPEETYVGAIQGVGPSPDNDDTAIWIVMGIPQILSPGLLQQSYAADPATPVDQVPRLVGEANSSIVLCSMTDKDASSTGAPQKSRPSVFVIVALDLKLKSAAV